MILHLLEGWNLWIGWGKKVMWGNCKTWWGSIFQQPFPGLSLVSAISCLVPCAWLYAFSTRSVADAMRCYAMSRRKGMEATKE